MSSGLGGKPDGGSQPGRPIAHTPQRLVVRSRDPEGEHDSTILGANDTAVAMAAKPGETQPRSSVNETRAEGAGRGDPGEAELIRRDAVGPLPRDAQGRAGRHGRGLRGDATR